MADYKDFTTKLYEIEKEIMRLQDEKRALIRDYNNKHKHLK